MNEETKKRIVAINSGIIPEGYKKTKVGIVPVEWKTIKLKNISKHITEKNKDMKHNETYTNSATQGIIKQTDYFDKQISNAENISSYYVVKQNDYVYNPRISVSAPCGPINKSHFSETGIMSPLYTVFRLNDEYGSNEYIEHYFKSSLWHRYMLSVANYGARHDRMNITNEDLFNMPLPIPPLPEQQKIAEILSTQDKLIELLERKMEQLKTLKKGYLQKMFPKKGCKYPELRFKGFTDPWEQRKFSEQYVKVNEKNNLSFGTDKIISVANMYFKEDTKNSDDDYMRTYNVMRLGDIAFEGHKSKHFAHGRFVENTIGNGIVSHIFDVFRPIADYDLMFWKYLINNEGVMGIIMTRCTKASTMMTNLVANDFLKEKIAVPSLDEQKQIGAYFSNLDNLITLHQRKLDEEKQKKKALMQLLLTGKVKVV
ncbi:MAG: restriction endonuclease subunit S [Oscillospiraceae bacterium]|nr:restriction endonuclease subunit S [Oscillospiraceae bacterium]